MIEKIVTTSSGDVTHALFGTFDSNVRMVERAFDVRISNHSGGTDMGDALTVTGNAECVDKAVRTLEYLKRMKILRTSRVIVYV